MIYIYSTLHCYLFIILNNSLSINFYLINIKCQILLKKHVKIEINNFIIFNNDNLSFDLNYYIIYIYIYI